VHVVGSLDKSIEQGSTFDVTATLDGVVPFKFSCPVCGDNCTVTVPIIKETYTIDLPPCPITAQKLDQTFSVALPSKSPIPVKLKAKAAVNVLDAAGQTLATLHLSASESAADQVVGSITSSSNPDTRM
jgi:hypothetical protein